MKMPNLTMLHVTLFHRSSSFAVSYNRWYRISTHLFTQIYRKHTIKQSLERVLHEKGADFRAYFTLGM